MFSSLYAQVYFVSKIFKNWIFSRLESRHVNFSNFWNDLNINFFYINMVTTTFCLPLTDIPNLRTN